MRRLGWRAFYFAIIIALSTGDLDGFAATPNDEAAAVLQLSGVQGGIVVQMNCGDGALTAALGAGESYLVQGLVADAAALPVVRENIRAHGVYGRVSAERMTKDRLPYIDNLVNLLVADAPLPVPMAEAMRVLTPGGVLCLRREGAWEKVVKPVSAGLGEWTHFLYDASNNPVTNDREVGPPARFQWISEPAWSKHHEAYPPTIPIMVSGGGRMFYFEEESPASMSNVQVKWFLTARDAYLHHSYREGYSLQGGAGG